MAIDFDMCDPDKRAWLEAHGYRNPIPGVITHARPADSPKRKQQGRGESKLELDFYTHLDSKPVYYWRKPIMIRVGPAMTFEPDAMVWDDMSNETFIIDTKGPHSWEDSRIKIKIAAEKFPMWRWLIVTRPEGIWKAKEVTVAKGIGRKAIDLPWLK